MTDTALKEEWKKFADAIGGSVSQTKESYFNPDKTYSIKTDKEEIILAWADEPARGRGANVTLQSVFRFKLKSGTIPYLRIQPKDFLTSMFFGLNKNRRKTEYPELDKAYIILANEQVLFSSLVSQLQQFHKQNRYQSFFIDTEKEVASRTLLIQVNELLLHTRDLSFFYEFGKNLRKVMESSV